MHNNFYLYSQFLIVLAILVRFAVLRIPKRSNQIAFVVSSLVGGYAFSAAFFADGSLARILGLGIFDILPAGILLLSGIFASLAGYKHLLPRFHEGEILLVLTNILYVIYLSSGAWIFPVAIVLAFLSLVLLREIFRQGEVPQVNQLGLAMLLCLSQFFIYSAQLSFLTGLQQMRASFYWDQFSTYLLLSFTMLWSVYWAALYLGKLLALPLGFPPWKLLSKDQVKWRERFFGNQIELIELVDKQNVKIKNILLAFAIHIAPLTLNLKFGLVRPEFLLFYLSFISPKLIKRWL